MGYFQASHGWPTALGVIFYQIRQEFCQSGLPYKADRSQCPSAYNALIPHRSMFSHWLHYLLPSLSAIIQFKQHAHLHMRPYGIMRSGATVEAALVLERLRKSWNSAWLSVKGGCYVIEERHCFCLQETCNNLMPQQWIRLAQTSAQEPGKLLGCNLGFLGRINWLPWKQGDALHNWRCPVQFRWAWRQNFWVNHNRLIPSNL